MRNCWFPVGLLFCLGCQTAPSSDWVGSRNWAPAVASKTADEQPAPAKQAAPGAIDQRLLTSAEADDALDLAASCVERGDSEGAAVHFQRHLKLHPEQIMIRAYLAELLFKMKRMPDAQDQFERFIAAAQDAAGAVREHVVHCHTRLMQIAQERGDAYGEHLHRGIGMVLLARQLEAARADEVDAGFREHILCKAVSELTRARKARPDEPRPCFYLAEVWTKLAQPRSADRALRQAKDLAALLPLAPAEQRALARAR
jgi:tetratricopeptide (TPR) repeat protein